MVSFHPFLPSHPLSVSPRCPPLTYSPTSHIDSLTSQRSLSFFLIGPVVVYPSVFCFFLSILFLVPHLFVFPHLAILSLLCLCHLQVLHSFSSSFLCPPLLLCLFFSQFSSLQTSFATFPFFPTRLVIPRSHFSVCISSCDFCYVSFHVFLLSPLHVPHPTHPPS